MSPTKRSGILRFPFCFLAATLLMACKEDSATTLFQLIPSSKSGVIFSNTLTESDSLNILNQANIYNGGGVGVGDFNNDGLTDLYFAGNMVSNKLYLNQGGMEFEDITEAAGVTGNGRWSTGVSVVDINADGWLDVYVSASFRADATRRTNLLYINQGKTNNGMPSFRESAQSYGLADTGFSTQAFFFDYDKDGDLDMYLVTNEIYDPKTPIRYRPKVTDGSALNTDRLYRNNGNETFTNVSKEAGIVIEGWGHAASISDFNLDGWPDIYVSNDFVANDLLYLNNQDGTFTNRISEYLKHSAWNAMGTDVADINNDGFSDIISLEMLPEDNMRKKKMLSGEEYFNYFNSKKYNYEHQYVRNVLQLNSGQTPLGHPVFGEIAFLAGVYQTDWSWTPLVADFDNDGLRDLIVTNGLPRDVTDLDYIKYGNGQGKDGSTINASLSMVDSLPVVKIPGYAFKNINGLVFADSTRAWGLDQPSFSNGAAYADLDNDGDLDIVVNNINDEAFLYENKLTKGDTKTGHYISFAFSGEGKNRNGIGASVRIYKGDRQWFYEHHPCRGYLSTVDFKAHFGLGGASQVDSIRIVWPDGKTELKTKVGADQLVTLSYNDAVVEKTGAVTNDVLFVGVHDLGMDFVHQEKDAIDYNIQPVLPHKLSQFGPGVAVGDIDNNGFDDFYVGGSPGNPGVFFMQGKSGKFMRDAGRINDPQHGLSEEMGVLLFDSDNDNDLDLYVVNGSYEFAPYHPTSPDRLYVNNGVGRFQTLNESLPPESTNGSCVRAADYDQDGDLDLFVGGRSVSGAYPVSPQNYILENRNGVFADVTLEVCPAVQQSGMISDALWTDFDNDGEVDLITAGEWMTISFYRNVGGKLTSATEVSGVAGFVGWWNSLASGDFDNDGDIDYVAGNLGLNSNFKASVDEPMTIYAKDLNQDGKIDPMIFCYMKAEDGTRKPFPMHTRDDMISQMVSIRRTYPTYKSFGMATMDKLWPEEERSGALTYKVNHLSSSYLENLRNGKFRISSLPLEAQIAPLFGMLAKDVNEDGNLDLMLVGNDFGMEPFSGRHDAFMGLILKGDGRGGFSAMKISESGFFVKGDAKALAVIRSATDEELFMATQNLDSLMVYKKRKSAQRKWITLGSNDFNADVFYKNGSVRRLEFYYGSTFLSQSSRGFPVGNDVSKVIITDFQGRKRQVDNPLARR